MTLTAGACPGAYEILAPPRAGGIGEMYRAKDTHLAGEVALKVLPAELSVSVSHKTGDICQLEGF